MKNILSRKRPRKKIIGNIKKMTIALVIMLIFTSFSTASNNQKTNEQSYETIEHFSESKVSESLKSILEFKYEFSTLHPVFDEHGMYFSIDGLDNTDMIGKPVIPQKTVRLLLPLDTEIDHVEVIPGPCIQLPKLYEYEVAIGQPAIPLSYKGEITSIQMDSELYNSVYPGDLYKPLTTQHKNGYKLFIANIYPLHYQFGSDDIPSEISYYQSITLKVHLRDCLKPDNIRPCRNLYDDRNKIQEIVESPNLQPILDTYSIRSTGKRTGSRSLVDPVENYEYVIITNIALRDADGNYTFQDLIQSKIDKGLNATLVTVEDIENCPEYWWDGAYGDGNSINNDTACHIRNFIKDAYENWNTTFVLLGGDGDGADVGGESGDDIIPTRELLDGGSLIASDLYYACLDGSFDANANGTYAETGDGDDIHPISGEVDLLAEVYVGRAPVDNAEELSNFVRKTLEYENSNDEDYLRNVWMVGEYLGFGGVAQFAGYIKDEVREGSSNHGYTTAGIPVQFDIRNESAEYTLYDRDVANWGEETIDLSAYIGNENVQIEFRLISDIGVHGPGLYIDNVEIIGDDSVIFYDDMENGENEWIHSGTNDEWELGSPFYSLYTAYSGENCWGTDLDDSYNDGSDQYLVSPVINLTNVTNANLRFFKWFWVEDYFDTCTVEITTDEGNSWTTLATYTGYGWQRRDIYQIINNGVHIINHLGHGNNFHFMKLDEPFIFRGDINWDEEVHDVTENLINNQYFFGYSQACYSGSFDNKLPFEMGYAQNDSIVERLVTSSHGAFAIVANTRFGWGNYYTTNGASQNFDREFFDALFGENKRSIGMANQDSKEDNIGKIASTNRLRWCYFEITLFGDPEVSLKNPPLRDHDVCVSTITSQKYIYPGDFVNVRATVCNLGANDEQNVVVNLYINNTLLNSTTIPSISSLENISVSFLPSYDTIGSYDLIVEVEPVFNESHLINNRKTKPFVVASSNSIKVCSLKGFFSSLFPDIYLRMNSQWHLHGTVPIRIDYQTLSHSDITYEDINASGADVILIHGCTPYMYILTPDEIEAITQYIEEGHGLIVIWASFGDYSVANDLLHPLVGLNRQSAHSYATNDYDYIQILDEAHPLFRNIPNPLVAFVDISSVSIFSRDGSWDNNELLTGTYAAKAMNDDDIANGAIVTNINNAVFISLGLEYPEEFYSQQLLYNAIVFANNSPDYYAIISGPRYEIVEREIQFRSIEGGGVSPYTYYWDFGDGNTSTLKRPVHAYSNPNTYTVNLTVTDNDSNIKNTSLEITINNTLTADANGPYIGGADIQLQFYGNASGGFPPYAWWYWDFGDENITEEQNPQHTYNSPGIYTVTLTVSDSKGFTSKNTTTVFITGGELIADAGGPYIDEIDNDIYFNGSANGGLPPYNWHWDFGDGNYSTQQNTTHSYSAPGIYNVTLTVTDNIGNNNSDPTVAVIDTYRVLNIDKNISYLEIQPAIDDADAGNTIFVSSSIYYENIVIDRSLTLIGENKETTIIDGNTVGTVVKITADGVTLNNFTIQNSLGTSGGLHINGANNCTIINSIIRNNDYSGIYIYPESNYNNIINNILTNDDGYGICLYPSSFNIISGNSISNNNQGIHISGLIWTTIYSTYNEIFDNTITNNKYGIYINGGYYYGNSDNNKIYHNNFIDNQYNARDYCDNINYWDNGSSGGNYWDDYTGADNNNDGFGDSPYSIIGGDNQDNYPLMYQWPWLIGDFNFDCIVDLNDFAMFASAYGTSEGHTLWNPLFDLYNDGRIDLNDFAIFALHFGEGC